MQLLLNTALIIDNSHAILYLLMPSHALANHLFNVNTCMHAQSFWWVLCEIVETLSYTVYRKMFVTNNFREFRE